MSGGQEYTIAQGTLGLNTSVRLRSRKGSTPSSATAALVGQQYGYAQGTMSASTGGAQSPVWHVTPNPTFVTGVASVFPSSGTYQSNGFVTDPQGDPVSLTKNTIPVQGTAWDGGRFVFDGTGSPQGVGGHILTANDGQGHLTPSPVFTIFINAPPAIIDSWQRLDAVASFNADPANSGLAGPSFGGATVIGSTGDIFFRNGGGTPAWNAFYRWNTKTLQPVVATPDGGTTHNHSWAWDGDRNVMWSGIPSPAEDFYYGNSVYDLATNSYTGRFLIGRAHPNDPSPPEQPPFWEGLASISSPTDYFDNYMYDMAGFGYGTQVMAMPIKRRNIATSLASGCPPSGGCTTPAETLFIGDQVGTGIGVPTFYNEGSIGEYPIMCSGFDSRTIQAWYLGPDMEFWINNSGYDGEPRHWVKLTSYGTKPLNASPSNLIWNRFCALHEALNYLVVLVWTTGPDSFTYVLDLNTMFWRAGPSGSASPKVSNFGNYIGVHNASRYSGKMMYDRLNQRLLLIEPQILPSGKGTALYQFHAAGPTI